jgi:hypothetical protein
MLSTLAAGLTIDGFGPVDTSPHLLIYSAHRHVILLLSLSLLLCYDYKISGPLIILMIKVYSFMSTATYHSLSTALFLLISTSC